MPRNREQTRQKILDAATALLLEKGFSGWGVNAIAREAKVDKVLIYRYFGSLERLLEEIIDTTRFWPDPGHLATDSAEGFIADTLDFLEKNPAARILGGLPPEDPCHRFIVKKSSSDLDDWLDALIRNCTGPVTEAKLACLPALIQYVLTNPGRPPTVHEIWSEVSPPLNWKEKEQSLAFEELPTELL